MIEYRKHITRDMVRDEREKLFVFGDNLQRRGLGGQAREMRGEINVIGIPTKRYPSMDEGAFFDEMIVPFWSKICGADITKLLCFNGVIVWPEAGIGTGRAQLKERCPTIWRAIERLRIGLEVSQKDGD